MTARDFEALTLHDLCDVDLSVEFLASLLKRGELALLLGAGISRGAGLPTWPELVARCQSHVGLAPSPSSNSGELTRAIDQVRRHAESTGGPSLTDIVRNCLYAAPVLSSGEYPAAVLQDPMLIAIGALVMASSRGSVGDVFTLNFDDVLEWYLALHGYRTQVVSEFPTYLRGDVDVTVFHPHGFVPLVESAHPRSEWLVLSHQQLVRRLAAGPDEPWPTLLGSRFLSKRFLAVGTSMNDLDIDVHIERARRAIHGGPVGVVVSVGIGRDRQEELLEVGLVPVVLDAYEDIPDFLLRICRVAARS